MNSHLPSATASVSIHSFPFLPKIVALGRIDGVTIAADRVTQGKFVFNRIVVTLSGVLINRTQLLKERRAEIEAIGFGRVTAYMSQADFSRLVGVPVTMGAGSARIKVAGLAITGRISISEGHLHMEAGRLKFSVPIPSLPILPCLVNVKITPGNLAVSCTFHEIPTTLLT